MPTVRANGIDIAYDDQGSGDTPVSPAARLSHWTRACGRRRSRALSGEVPRHSSRPARPRRVPGSSPGHIPWKLLADDLTGFLDALDIPQVVLGGFSMGGYVAFAFYRKNPGARELSHAPGHQATARLR